MNDAIHGSFILFLPSSLRLTSSLNIFLMSNNKCEIAVKLLISILPLSPQKEKKHVAFIFIINNYKINSFDFIYKLAIHSSFTWILWFKITDFSLISLNIRNYFLQKHIKFSRKFNNFYAIYNSNKYSKFRYSSVEII